MNQFLPPSKAAELLGIHVDTLIAWTKFPCIRTPGGHRRYRKEDIQRYLDETFATNQSLEDFANEFSPNEQQ